MCTVLLPPGGNSIAVNKYINMNKSYRDWPEIKPQPPLRVAGDKPLEA